MLDPTANAIVLVGTGLFVGALSSVLLALIEPIPDTQTDKQRPPARSTRVAFSAVAGGATILVALLALSPVEMHWEVFLPAAATGFVALAIGRRRAAGGRERPRRPGPQVGPSPPRSPGVPQAAPAVADLHAHYPAHLMPFTRSDEWAEPRSGGRRVKTLLGRAVFRVNRWLGSELGYSGPRVTLSLLEAGGVRLVLSALYVPYAETDLAEPYGAPPRNGYLPDLLRELELVEADVARDGRAVVAHGPAELESALADGRLALVHSVEGGFHLGGTPEVVGEAVRHLASRGVAYITLAHLFWRSVATNVPGLPSLPAWLYRLLFPQPAIGLSELGRAAVEAMVRERVLIDLSHMSERAMSDTFELLDRLDPERTVPVLATHTAYRFGRSKYNLDDGAIERIAARGGLVGLTVARGPLTDGLRGEGTATFADSVEVVCRHIDRIRELTGSHRHLAIGSDLDGSMRPSAAGLEDSSRLAELGAALQERYGAEAAEMIASGNVLRVLRGHWRNGPGSGQAESATR